MNVSFRGTTQLLLLFVFISIILLFITLLLGLTIYIFIIIVFIIIGLQSINFINNYFLLHHISLFILYYLPILFINHVIM